MLQQFQTYRRRARAAFTWGAALAVLGLAMIARDAFAQAAAPTADPQADPVLQAVMVLVKGFGGAVKAGEAFTAVVLGVVLLVLLLRVFGKKLHDAIPDDSIWDKPLWFIFETKPGGLLLNAASSFGLSIAAVAAAGTPITPALTGVVAMGSGGVVGLASGVYGWAKDLYEWWKARKPPADAAQAAGVEAGKSPGDTLNG